MIRKSLSRDICTKTLYTVRNLTSASKSISNEKTNKSEFKEKMALLPAYFLRQSDASKYDNITHQRNDVSFDISDGRPFQHENESATGQISVISISDDQDNVEIRFSDGSVGNFSKDWIDMQIQRRSSSVLHSDRDGLFDLSPHVPRIPWKNLSESQLRSTHHRILRTISFNDLVLRSESRNKYEDLAIKILFQSGILLITSTPIDDGGAGIAALASALSGAAHKTSAQTSPLAHYQQSIVEGTIPNLILEHGTDGPLRTLYGSLWSTNSKHMNDGVSTADSAYGNEALPLHNDMCYHRDPPGLQIFTMKSPADQGGESIFADGLALAEHMRRYHKDEFDTLCSVPRRYRSLDKETGWHLEAIGPVFKVIDRGSIYTSTKMGENINHPERWGPFLAMRHNDLDRLPDLPSPDVPIEKTEEYYGKLGKAHYVLDTLLARDEFRLIVNLKPGDTVVIANQRCLHGRKSFKTSSTPRSVMGCYVSQDDLDSRVRWYFGGNITLQ